MNEKQEPDLLSPQKRRARFPITLENKVSLQWKLSSIFILIFSGVSFLNFYMTTFYAASVLHGGIGRELLAAANTSSLYFSKQFGAVFSRQPFRMSPAEAQMLLSQLKAIQKANGCDAVYIFLRVKNQSCMLSEVQGQPLLCVPSELSGEAREAFHGQANFMHRLDVVKTAYAPIRGPDGKVAAVIGVEGSTRSIQMQVRALRDQAIFFLVFTIVFSSLTGVIVARAITIPVLNLLSGMLRVARGELKFKVRVKSIFGFPFRDEIGDLVIAFNHMTQVLLQKSGENKLLYDEIQKMNRELEQRVKDATQELELSNKKLLEKEAQRDSELKLAQQIQQMLLPQSFKTPSVAIESLFLPAAEIGGDFYAYIPVDEEHLGVVIGDVSGRGIPAALLMTMTLGILQETSQHSRSPKDILKRTNETMVSSHKTADFSDFASCFYAMLNIPKKTLVFARAGHDMPLWFSRKKNDIVPLRGEGTFLGSFRNSVYSEHTVHLSPGDKVIFYTDGITSVKNKAGQRFQEEMLCALILAHGNMHARELLETIQEELVHFTQDVPRDDDLALVVLEVL